MRSRDYGPDVLAGHWRRRAEIPVVPADPGLVVEHAETGFCGSIVTVVRDAVTLEDRGSKRRMFPLAPQAFMIDGRLVTLVRPRAQPAAARRTASGSVAAAHERARVAVASRLFVEGSQDAQLVERLWGDDLRHEGVVVEILDGADNLPGIVRSFAPGPGNRMGVLLDHLVTGSKESRVVSQIRSPHVLVRGHPYVDVWQAVKPRTIGLDAWPVIPKGLPWKETMAEHLGHPDHRSAWRFLLGRVNSYADLEPAMLAPVEELIDFVTAPHHRQG